jgi:TRAP-type C4-dicarboxylate transport system permease small subunit
MNKAYALFEKILNFMMAFFLGLMGIFIFGNVVLRYFFNSGITWAEEFSRFLFVWLVFLGALGAFKDNSHLGFTSLVQRLPSGLKKIVYIISNVIVVGCLWILLDGSLEMTTLTMDSFAPSTGLPIAYMYAVGILTGVGMAVMVLFNIYKAFFVPGAIDELVVLRESEEEIKSEPIKEGVKL